MFCDSEIERHLKTHSERSADDDDAVFALKFFLRSNGRIHATFATNDKEPNIDGRFELVSDPSVSRRPAQSFVVQIKGTNAPYIDKDGVVKYSLKSLAFLAYVYKEVTLDPGILFVVFHAGRRGEERVFWKYISSEFLRTIDFSMDSTTISFSADDELTNTEGSILRFCSKLEEIVERHSFIKKLDNREYSERDINDIIRVCDDDITEYLDYFEQYQTTRDTLSRRILTKLNDLCVAALLLNSQKLGGKCPSLNLAWEQALLDIKTKYLSSFYRMLRYPGSRIPAAGQAERLMLKYYDFMWQIRRDLKEDYGIIILKNLEKFPLKKIDEVDAEYYRSVAKAINGMSLSSNQLQKTRYYIQKKTPFYIDGERYYEVTLQLAGIYASKFNRLTVYTKENISTNYSIRIGYDEVLINLWGNDARIKVVTNWQVSIDPTCLNKLAKILKKPVNINSTHKEYLTLMEFFTRTGISLVDLIDLKDSKFFEIIDKIYKEGKKETYKDILLTLKAKYSRSSTTFGRNVVRYLLVRLREETLDSVIPSKFDKKLLCDDLFVTSRCVPFEKSPYISNLAGSKTSGVTFTRDVAAAVGYDRLEEILPYLRIKELVNETREVYFEQGRLGAVCNATAIKKFNDTLDEWECQQGFRIREGDGLFYIESFARETIEILQNLLNRSQKGNEGQQALNRVFLQKFEAGNEPREGFDDDLKRKALQNVFVKSKLLLIYGAAGTGKTTLINTISNLMGNRKKLFLTKTHAAKNNLERRIDNRGVNSEFVSIDSFAKKVNPSDFDVVFVDECSTIDNRTMKAFLRKLDPDTLLVLAGDIYQIESIEFGNWFYYAKDVITTEGANVELLSTWRTKDGNLIGLWDEVRNKGELITEKLSYDGPYSEDIGPNILKDLDDNEVVLCLNYDGKFGLNNINTYFQNNNHTGEAVVWQEWTYKVGDKILFDDTKRFSVLYNNLKGKIVGIKKGQGKIHFTIDVETLLTESDCRREELAFIEVVGENTTRVMFTVSEDDGGTTEQERDLSRKKSIVPFHLAYAVSIHKAQGLEYDSVKVIIPSSNSEKITHGIFYTAITRAKLKLKIYWSPETMRDVIQKFEAQERNTQSLEMVKKQLKLS